MNSNTKISNVAVNLVFLVMGLAGVVAGQDLNMIEEEAVKKWPDKPEMQAFQKKEEMEAYRKLELLQPDQVVKKDDLAWLKGFALKKWPRSYSMQFFTIKKEVEAGHELAKFQLPKGMPVNVYSGILDEAGKKWEEWSMVLHVLKKQSDAWVEVQRLKADAKTKEEAVKAEKEWPGNFEMQVYVVKKAVTAK